MRGSIQKISTNRWRLVYDLPRENGKRRQRVCYFTGGKRDAEARLSELVDAVRGGFRGTKLTLTQYIGGWIDSRTLAPTTRGSMKSNLDHYITPRIGEIPLDEITPLDLQRLYATLLKDGGQNSKPLRATSVKVLHSMLRSAFEDATRMGLVRFNPATRVRPPNGKRKLPEPMSAVKLRAVLDALRDTPFWFLAFVASVTAARMGELLGLEREDFDLDRGVVHIRRSIDRFENVKTPKNGRGRQVMLDSTTEALLAPYLPRAGRVFQFKASTISQRFIYACKQAGFPGVRLHLFRHTVASLLFAAKVHPKIVQEILGHHSPAFTMEQYAHTMPGMHEEASALIGKTVRDQSVTLEGKFARKPL